MNLLSVLDSALERVRPSSLFKDVHLGRDDAILLWGKAARASWQVLANHSQSRLSMVVSHEPEPDGIPAPTFWIRGEHPLPGPGSYLAGALVLDFLDSLRRFRIRNLHVFLSGGASSLAWVRPGGCSAEELNSKLNGLYRSGLPIAELNRRRSALCALKNGRSARWLSRVAPHVQARVTLISDVAPDGPEVIGSGPFYDGKVPHQVIADNILWVREIARKGHRILAQKAALRGSWESWVDSVESSVRTAIHDRATGLLILGGEPSVTLPPKSGLGGRQTQIALGVLLRLHQELTDGKIQVVCASSDGVDGHSRAAGAILDARVAKSLSSARALAAARDALSGFDSARVLSRAGALLPASSTGTNVQDVVLVRVNSSGKTFA